MVSKSKAIIPYIESEFDERILVMEKFKTNLIQMKEKVNSLISGFEIENQKNLHESISVELNRLNDVHIDISKLKEKYTLVENLITSLKTYILNNNDTSKDSTYVKSMMESILKKEEELQYERDLFDPLKLESENMIFKIKTRDITNILPKGIKFSTLENYILLVNNLGDVIRFNLGVNEIVIARESVNQYLCNYELVEENQKVNFMLGQKKDNSILQIQTRRGKILNQNNVLCKYKTKLPKIKSYFYQDFETTSIHYINPNELLVFGTKKGKHVELLAFSLDTNSWKWNSLKPLFIIPYRVNFSVNLYLKKLIN